MSVPSHCYLLEEAQEELAKLLNEVEFKKPSIPIIPNVLAEPTSDVDIIKNSLINQLTKTVRWRETLDYLQKNNLSHLIDSGPGKNIINMARKIKDIDKLLLRQTNYQNQECSALCDFSYLRLKNRPVPQS